MPKLTEEKEDMTPDGEESKRYSSGSNPPHIMSAPTTTTTTTTSSIDPELMEALTANKTLASLANHHTISAHEQPQRLQLLRKSQQLGEYTNGHPLPEICEDSMGPPTATVSSNAQTHNHLLGVPDHFLSSTGVAPDLTQSSEQQTGGESPDLLRVNSGIPRAFSMPPLSPEDDGKREGGVSLVDSVLGKLETAECTELQSQAHRIYGRFSSADESLVQ